MLFSCTFILEITLAFLVLVNGRVLFPGRVFTCTEDIAPSYDYLVVGGGTSGLVVASRLSEDENISVLIIESGGFDQNEDFITVPLISSGNVPELGRGAVGTRYDWNLTSSSQDGLQGRIISEPAGKVVGGGTVLNGMVWNRASATDYDKWQALGNPGWSFANLLPYFKKSETFTAPSQALENSWNIGYNLAYHGTTGPIESSYPPFVWPSTKYFIDAMRQLDIPVVTDPEGGNAVGSFWFTISLDPSNETRSTAANYYVQQRPNLHLLTGFQVTKILTKPGNPKPAAIGVQYGKNANAPKMKVLVNKEIVLAAGALHTPQILELSGIGDSRILTPLGIDCAVDLPGVGSNYQDHPLLVTAQDINLAFNFGNFSNATFLEEQRALYDTKREGPFTTTSGNFFAFLDVPTFVGDPSALLSTALAQNATQYLPANTQSTVVAGYEEQFKLLVQDFTSTTTATMEFIFSDTIIIPNLHHPFSRGTVHINSTSAFSPPIINPRYLSNPLDTMSLISAFNFSRTIRNTPALKSVGVVETYPGLDVQSTTEIAKFIQQTLATENHHAGTASMLPLKLGGVVDSNLKVYGISGLRVVDASIMPLVPASHLQTTVYAVAEKAADLIKMSRK